MRKSSLLLTMVISLFSCEKNNDAVESKRDYTSFLEQSTRTFSGKLDGADFSWTYGSQSQGTLGYENGPGVCDSTDPVRVLMFGLTSESDFQTRFILYSPSYNSDSITELSKVFSLGKKKLGDYRNAYYLVMSKANVSYQSSGLDPANVIEVLKTQEFTDYFGEKKVRVWFRIDAKLSSSNSQNNKSSIADGLMIGEFYDFRKTQ